MCEYAKFDGDIPICTVDDNKLCTLCVGKCGNIHKSKRTSTKGT